MNKERGQIVSRNSRTAWTIDEIRVVEQHYGTLSVAEIGKLLGRTRSSVRSMANRLKCCAEYDLWSDAEVDILRTHYAAGADMGTLLAMLPRRTKAGIRSKVDTLGIIRRRWREDENRILRKYYLLEGIATAVRLPGRTASAIRNQAYALGLYRPRRIKWSEEEWVLLEKNQHLDLSELHKLFPGRSPQAVCHARIRLKQSQGTD